MDAGGESWASCNCQFVSLSVAVVQCRYLAALSLEPLTVQNYCNYLANFARFAVVLNHIGFFP